MTNRFLIRVALFAMALGLAGTLAAAAPRLVLTAAGGEAQGLTAGGDSIWFVVSIRDFGGIPQRGQIARVVSDTDRDGVVTLEIPPGRSSTWVVVDFATGEYAIASAAGAPVVELTSQGKGWGAGAEAEDFDALQVETLLVRPGKGAWIGHAEANGRGDRDPRLDNLRVSLADMLPLLASREKSPPVALPKDLLIAIDRTDLRTYIRAAGEGSR